MYVYMQVYCSITWLKLAVKLTTFVLITVSNAFIQVKRHMLLLYSVVQVFPKYSLKLAKINSFCMYIVLRIIIYIYVYVWIYIYIIMYVVCMFNTKFLLQFTRTFGILGSIMYVMDANMYAYECVCNI